jgi:hypothetical protein
VGARVRRAHPTLALVALLAAGVAHADADPLATVRAALQRLPGQSPITAQLERAVTNERKDRPLEAGRATFDVTAGSSGITIGYPAGLLEEIRAERADTDPEKPNPARRTLENFDAIDVGDMLNAATGLLSDLDGAKLVSETAAEHDGRPARLLELELQVRVSKADNKWVKRASRTMKLWTTADGVPLAAESDATFVVGLLFFTFDAREQRSQTFTRSGDRLVTLRRTVRFDGEGLGESTHTSSDTTLRLPTRS